MTDHMLGHQKSFGKFKKIEIISSTFYDKTDIKLQICNKRNFIKSKNT